MDRRASHICKLLRSYFHGKLPGHPQGNRGKKVSSLNQCLTHRVPGGVLLQVFPAAEERVSAFEAGLRASADDSEFQER